VDVGNFFFFFFFGFGLEVAYCDLGPLGLKRVR
jgi:hypothetical protein